MFYTNTNTNTNDVARRVFWIPTNVLLGYFLLLGISSFSLAFGENSLPLSPVAQKVEFDTDIRPILEKGCFDCHTAETSESDLRLDDVVGILRGGNSGEPLFVPGSGAESLLIKRVTSHDPKERMPLDGEALSDAEIELLRVWIDHGARMPGDEAAKALLKPKTDHWSFQLVKRPKPPNSDDLFRRNEIDAFVLAKLREKGLSPSAPADRQQLIRRLYLTMHGLPPTPNEVTEFVNDPQPDAYSRLVERVLASPRYGERWARHWMDVVRYADTNGFETNRERKTAYHYRDYLIESFNADKPYDRFVREQLAGDAFGVDAATGFLVAGAYDIVKAPDINLTLMQRQDELADMVNTTGTAFMGLTVGCARCHNHKFDPILQKDYYAMQAVFAGVNHGERLLREKLVEGATEELAKLQADEQTLTDELNLLMQKGAEALVADPKESLPPVNARCNEDVFPSVEATSVRFTITASSGAEPCIDELEVYDEAGQNVALASKGARPSASGTLPGFPIHRLEHINDGKVGNDHSWISNSIGTGWIQIDFPAKAVIRRIVWGRDRTETFSDRVAIHYSIDVAAEPEKWITVASSEQRAPFSGTPDPHAFLAGLSSTDAARAQQLQRDLAAVRDRIEELSGKAMGWVGTFSEPERTHRLYRGDPLQAREVVAPDSPTILGSLGLAVNVPEQRRRVALANWIADAQHPLTARVMVNRLWHYLFGSGIVDTPSDFGVNGGRPTHPELLDWLADEFVQGGWSIKHIQRLILLSSTFQQRSAPRAEALAVDADNRYLWRFAPRRLEAEAIRDSILAASGAMDWKMGGPGFYLMDVVEENVMHYFPKETYAPTEFRRMVYLFRIRQATDSVFGSFDCPDGGQVIPRRSRSNTPLQALNLYNSSFILQQSEILAARVSNEAGNHAEAQVNLAFALLFGRTPDTYEQQLSVTMIQKEGLPSFCRALFNASEFLFVF
jgi:Protein of unknown function (DUF1553)/Protein of unknown function (DUF1549)/Planctomycete cytochrome C